MNINAKQIAYFVNERTVSEMKGLPQRIEESSEKCDARPLDGCG